MKMMGRPSIWGRALYQTLYGVLSVELNITVNAARLVKIWLENGYYRHFEATAKQHCRNFSLKTVRA